MLGFNTRETFYNATGRTIYEYYLIDNDKYSNVEIDGPSEYGELFGVFYGLLNTKEWDNFYDGQAVHYEFPQNQNSVWIFSLRGLGESGISVNNPDIINGQEIIFSYSRAGLLKIINENDMIILIYTNGIVKYYNTPEYEIEHKYLRLFVKNIIRIINSIYLHSIKSNEFTSSFRLDFFEFFEYMLPNFKKQELAIIRNLLFARHNYAFQTTFWRDFIKMYYPENYVGVYTELEVMNQFNWFEEWILDLIINYENDFK
jgi:hypothetical protein